MKLIFAGEGDVHLGSLEIDGDNVTIEKYKKDFNPKIVDAESKDDGDDGLDPGSFEGSSDGDGKMSSMFAMKKPAADETETVDNADEEESEPSNIKKPMKQKRAMGMF